MPVSLPTHATSGVMTRALTRAFTTLGITVALLAGTVSCSHFVDPKPQDVLTPGNFFQSSNDAVAAVSGVYQAAANTHVLSYWYLSDIATDDILPTPRFGSDGQRMSSYTFDASDIPIDDAWRNFYVQINRANAVIGRVPGVQMDTALRSRLIAEARFLRADAYFNLVRFYGDVPLVDQEVTSLQNLSVPRTPAAQVYAFLIADLQAAAATLPASYSGADLGRVTRGAALANLAKVYLQQKDWTKAAATAGQVIASGTYQLNADWHDNFRVALKLTNPESIYEINYDGALNPYGGSLTTIFSLPDGFPGGAAYGLMTMTPDALALFSAQDVRGQNGTYITSPYTIPAGVLRDSTVRWAVPAGPAFLKYLDVTNTQNMTARDWELQPNDWIVLRYADVLLMYAEAVAEGGAETAGSALTALNQVRTRAGLAPFAALALDSVRAERRREFIFEGQRWFDLVRYGTLTAAIQAKTGHPPKASLFPIPQTELDVNTQLTQNAGY